MMGPFYDTHSAPPIPAEALTHGGKFHADDVFGTALLQLLRPDIQVRRSFRVPADFAGLVYDIGGGPFDHHQKGAPVRPDGVPYAAFGLLWHAYGEILLQRFLPPMPTEQRRREALRFDEKFVQPLDLDDNTGCGCELAALIGDFNPAWDEDSEPDSAFWRAVAFADTVLRNRLHSIAGFCRAKALVEQALQQMQDGVVILPRFAPWKSVLSPSEAVFCVYPSQRGGWCAQGVPIEDGGGQLKCPFPPQWAGLEDEALQRTSGIGGLTFCHNNRFLIAATTRQDALAACRAAVQLRGQDK